MINAYCLAALIKMFLIVYRAMIFLNAVSIVLNLTEPFLCSYIQNILTLSELLYSSYLTRSRPRMNFATFKLN